MAYGDYTIRVMVTGDYEFLCKIYGIFGASGMYCISFNQLSKHKGDTAAYFAT